MIDGPRSRVTLQSRKYRRWGRFLLSRRGLQDPYQLLQQFDQLSWRKWLAQQRNVGVSRCGGVVVTGHKREGRSRFFKQVGKLGTVFVAKPNIEKHRVVVVLGDLVTSGMDVMRRSRNRVAKLAKKIVDQVDDHPFILNDEDSGGVGDRTL